METTTDTATTTICTVTWDATPPPGGVPGYQHKLSFVEALLNAKAHLPATIQPRIQVTVGSNVAAIIAILPQFVFTAGVLGVGPLLSGSLLMFDITESTVMDGNTAILHGAGVVALVRVSNNGVESRPDNEQTRAEDRAAEAEEAANAASPSPADLEISIVTSPEVVEGVAVPRYALNISGVGLLPIEPLVVESSLSVDVLSGAIATLARYAFNRNRLTPSEAVFGFAAWLTTRDRPVALGSNHDAAVAAELCNRFISTNNLGDCRPDWNQVLKHPETTDDDRAQLQLPPLAAVDLMAAFVSWALVELACPQLMELAMKFSAANGFEPSKLTPDDLKRRIKLPDTSGETDVFNRLEREHSELQVRCLKLSDFLESPKFETLPDEAKRLLTRQHGIMLDYASVLSDRIAVMLENR